MLCLGSIYAWSIIALELIKSYFFSASQSQLVFGTSILIFPLTMIIIGRSKLNIHPRLIGYLAGVFFFLGYLLSGFSAGNFYLILLGTGFLAGIGTGLGYWLALTFPVQCFPNKKGLVTGLVAAGFGLGAVFMSELAELILNYGYDVLQLMKFFGLVYGLIILVFSNFIYAVCNIKAKDHGNIKFKTLIQSSGFLKLFLGIFLGTFAGLLIIGSLRMIGSQYAISDHIIVLGIAIFASANFLGRIFWGFISDYFQTNLIIFIDLFLQAIAILSLILFNLSSSSYLIIVSLIGFGFGGNFVLFAKETAQIYGIKILGQVYPYIFMGYAIAGILGPLSGGFLYDLNGSYTTSIILASFMSLLGSILFLVTSIFKGEKFNE